LLEYLLGVYSGIETVFQDRCRPLESGTLNISGDEDQLVRCEFFGASDFMLIFAPSSFPDAINKHIKVGL
jgi:hypothetical protein